MRHEDADRGMMGRSRLAPVGRFFAPVKEAIAILAGCNPARMASSIAYYGAFSLAPLLVIAISIASMVFGKSASEGLILDQLSQALGEDTARFIQSLLASFYTGGRLTLATVLAGLLLLWASTRIIGAVRGALNDIWGVTARGRSRGRILGYVFGKLMDMGTVLAFGLMFLGSMAASAVVSSLADLLSRKSTVPGWVLQLAGIVLALVMATLFLALVFRLLPNIRVRFVYILGGSSLTAVLFVFGNYLIGRYLGGTAAGSAFGAAGSLIVIMLWLNYTAYIILFGAALTRAYTERGAAGKKATEAPPDAPEAPPEPEAKAKRSDRKAKPARD